MLLFIFSLSWPVCVHAQSATREEIKAAKKLYQKARKLLRKGETAEGIKLIADAERLHQHWSYPFGMAQLLIKAGENRLAWEALDRATLYGVPARRQRVVDRLVSQTETKLFATHALIHLQVEPPDAKVSLDGKRWNPPYRKWVSKPNSRVVLEHGSFAPKVEDWEHGVGGRVFHEIRMESSDNYGRINVEGTPLDATVKLDGKSIGTLGNARSNLLKPGRYPVAVSRADYLTEQRTAVVHAGRTTTINVQLSKAVSPAAELLTSRNFWGWTTAGMGVASLITSAALLGYASSIVTDIETLNINHVSGFTDYEREYRVMADDVDTYATAGYVTMGFALALGTTGTVLLLYEYGVLGQSEGKSSSWNVFPTPMGAGAVVQF